MADDGRGGFWTTLPGLLTGLAALITAAGGLWLAVRDDGPASAPAAVPVAPSQPVTTTMNASVTRGPAAAPPVAAGPTINLLTAAGGAEIVAASSDDWAKVSDGDEASEALLSGEVVYALATPTVFDTFGIFVPGTLSYNVEQYELSVADASETGPFTVIGTFPVKNIKLYKSPYQEVTFPPLTAKFFRFRIVKPTNGAAVYELRLRKG